MSNIKVYLRIRPNLSQPADSENKKSTNSPNPKPTPDFAVTTSKLGKSLSIRTEKKHYNDRRFEFEDIFESSVDQPQLFGHFQERILESATNGVI